MSAIYNTMSGEVVWNYLLSLLDLDFTVNDELCAADVDIFSDVNRVRSQ